MKFGAKTTGLAAAIAEAEEAKRKAAALTVKPKSTSIEAQERESAGFVEPDNPAVKDRIRIIFDDSGSMIGQTIKDAQDGCIEFMKNCEVNKAAVAVHPMNADAIALDTNLPKLAALMPLIHDSGGTPMFETLQKAQAEEPKATRYIIFTDGQPNYNDLNMKESCISKAIEFKTPIDTVLIGLKDSPEAHLMKEIADRTGGIFLVFERGKANFKTAFKYLSPGLRLQLMADNSLKAKVEAGAVK